MEDTIIVKGHYCYMFRVDLSANQQSKLEIDKWLELYSFSHWLGCHEIGTETGKHHYQMVVWREHKFLQKEQTKARNWWRGKTNSVSHGAALSSARKVASLASYSIKDEKSEKNVENGQLFSTLSNLSKEQMKKIPQWKSKSAHKLKNIEKLESTLKTVSKHLTKSEFCAKLNQIYYSIYDRPLLHRNTYIKYLYKYEYCKEVDILNWVFPMGIPGEDSLTYENEIHTKNIKNNYKVKYNGPEYGYSN